MKIFGNKKANGQKDALQAVKEMGNAPITAYAKAEHQFYEIYGSPKVESTRWFVFSLASLFVIVAMAMLIWRMLPLKTVVPYMVSFDQNAGEVARPVAASSYSPDANYRKYFITQWTERVYTIDPFQTKKNISFAFSRTRQKATSELTNFLDNEDKPFKRMADDPRYTRVVRVISVDPGRDNNIALVRFQTEERSGVSPPTYTTYMLQLHYALVPPETEDEIRLNPLGLYVTHFTRTTELNATPSR